MKKYIVKLANQTGSKCEWLEVARFKTEAEAFAWMFAQPGAAYMNVFVK